MSVIIGRAGQVWACVLLAWLLKKTNGKVPDFSSVKDVQVTCQVSEDCVLPCRFEPSGGEKIEWYKYNGILIFSYSKITYQSNRVLVSTKQLELGNATLVLQQSELQDRGRYTCKVISAEKERNVFVLVKIEAPIRTVNLTMTRLSGFEELKCSTSDVFPPPQIFWSTDPSTPFENLKYTTRKIGDKQGRYTVESKLKRLDRSDLIYICTLNSSSTQLTWKAFLTVAVRNNITSTSTSYETYKWAEMNPAEGQNLTIPCKSPWDFQNFALTWSFTTEKKTTDVCTYDSQTALVTNNWESNAILEHQRLKNGDASLTVLNLTGREHAGVYTCSISATQRRHVGRIKVNITSEKPESKRDNLKSSATQWWIPAVALVLLAILAAFIIGMMKSRGCQQSKKTGNTRYSKSIQVTVPENEATSEGIRLTAMQNSEHT